jgi:complement component 1 Q subcomponent-binding protein
VLTQESEFEKDNYTRDESLGQYMEDNGWKLEEKDTSNLMILKKSVNGQNVSVYFTSKSPNLEDDEEEDKQKEKNQEEYDAEQGYNDFDFVEFTVYIEKNPNKILAIDALSVDGDLQINTCNVISDINGHRQMNPFSNNTNNYKGPEFDTLDETLQSSLFDYIGSFGINQEFAQLVEMQA